jgi:hypothetical protein
MLHSYEGGDAIRHGFGELDVYADMKNISFDRIEAIRSSSSRSNSIIVREHLN